MLLPAKKGAPDTKRVRVKSCYEMVICGWAVREVAWPSDPGLLYPLWALGFSTPTWRMRTFAPILPCITVSFLKVGANKCQLALHAGIHYVAETGA
jgi:hypothetical protein